jgi:hypothetical protein
VLSCDKSSVFYVPLTQYKRLVMECILEILNLSKDTITKHLVSGVCLCLYVHAHALALCCVCVCVCVCVCGGGGVGLGVRVKQKDLLLFSGFLMVSCSSSATLRKL